jgi:hypothetical protein
VKEFLCYFGVLAVLYFIGVLADKFEPVDKGFKGLGLAFTGLIYGFAWVFNNSVPQDEEAAAAWFITLILAALYSWRLLVRALLCYLVLFLFFKSVRWWDKRKRDKEETV